MKETPLRECYTTGWGWSALQTETKTDRFRKVGEATTGLLPCLAPDHRSIMWRGFPETPAPPLGRQPGRQPEPKHCGCFVGPPTLASPQGDYRETCRDQPLGIWLRPRNRRAHNRQHSVLATRVPTWSTQIVIPTSHFAHLQNHVRPQFDQETCWGAALYDLGPQTQSFTGLRAWFAHTQERSWITAPLWGGRLPGPLQQGLLGTPISLLELSRRSCCPKANTVLGLGRFSCSIQAQGWTHRKGWA